MTLEAQTWQIKVKTYYIFLFINFIEGEGSTCYNETEGDNVSQTQDCSAKVLDKSESGVAVANQLNNVFDRLDSVFKKYEEGRASLLKKNIELMQKIEQVIRSKS